MLEISGSRRNLTDGVVNLGRWWLRLVFGYRRFGPVFKNQVVQEEM